MDSPGAEGVEVAPAPEGAGVVAGTDGTEETPLGEDGVGVTIDEPAGVLAGETPVGLAGIEVVSVTGQMVVETAMVEVTTLVESAGQLVTVEAHLVTVISLVMYTVEVVNFKGVLVVVDPVCSGGTMGVVGIDGTVVVVGTDGTVVVVPGVQSKPML
jgi:hypothetical protein